MKHEKLTKLSIRSHPELSERWVQERIADDPSILGLGDVILKDKERNQPRAGRLDVLLQEADGIRRYEVEIQLGKTDESHIIRTLEYWDIERKRYPLYEHTAVIVAEEITGRFLNVIGLFNGTIPLIAIQLSAFQVGDAVSLVFTTVLDQVRLGLAEDDEEIQESTDRLYWERRGSKATLAMVDDLFAIVQSIDPKLQLTFTRAYVGLARDGRPFNFAVFKPRKSTVRFEPRIDKTVEIDEMLDASGLDVNEYNSRSGRYAISLQEGNIKKNADVIQRLLAASYRESGGGEG